MQGAVIEETMQMMHQTPINAYCHNHRANCFVTTDEKAIKLWNMEGEIRNVNLPSRTSYLIQTIEYIPCRNIYMASALDGTLRFYDENIIELASIFTHRATILCLVFDEQRNRIISGGIDGCGAWLLRGKDTEGYDESHVMRNPAYQVAPLELFNKTGTTWVRRMKIDADANRLLVLAENTIYLYNLADASLVDTYKKIVKSKCGAITDFLVFKKKSIIASCMDGSIYVVTIYPRSTVAVFKEHTKTVTSLALDNISGLLFSSSLDNTVRMWDIDLLRNVHQLRLETPLASLYIVPQTNPVEFLCQARQAMKIMTLKHTLKEHSTLASPLAILQHLHAEGKNKRLPTPAGLLQSRRKVSSMHIIADALAHQAKIPAVIHEEHVVSICLDKSIRIFAGTDMITPITTYVPEDAQDVVGFAFNAFRDYLYILMRKQILLFDIVEDIVVPKHVISIDNRSVKCISVCLVPPQFYTKPRHSQAASRRRLNTLVDFVRNATGSSSNAQSVFMQAIEAWIVCGTDKGELLFSSTAHKSLDEATVQQAHPSAITMLGFTSPTAAILVSFGADKSFCFWRMTPRVARIGTLTMGDLPSCIQIAPTSFLLLCGFEDGRVDLIDFSEPEPLVHSSDINHAALVTAADFADALNIVITTSFDMTIKVWDQNKNLLKDIQMATPLTCLCFMNTHGDVFVGMQAKMFTIAGADILPPKLPPKRSAPTDSASQTKLLSRGGRQQIMDESFEGIVPTELDNEEEESEVEKKFQTLACKDFGQDLQLDPTKQDMNQTRQGSPTRMRRPVQVLTSEVVVYNPPVLRSTKPEEPRRVSLPIPIVPEVTTSPQTENFDARQFNRPAVQVNDAMARYKNRKERMLQNATLSKPFKPPSKSSKPPTTPANEPSTPPSIITPDFTTTPRNHVQRTPRKLWNAIGAEDRRLIVLQRTSTEK